MGDILFCKNRISCDLEWDGDVNRESIGLLPQDSIKIYKIEVLRVVFIYKGEAWVVQWSERWTLGRTARVRVLAGALRCGLKQAASFLLDATVCCLVYLQG